MPVVSGRVTDHAGQGVAGVYVSALPAEGGRFGRAPGTHTDGDGEWTLELPPGAWRVRETGFAAREVLVGDALVELGTADSTGSAPTPTRDALEALLLRRRSTREDA